MPETSSRVYEFGAFTLDVNKRLLLKDGQVVPLTSKGVDTLLALVQHHARVIDKDELLKLIWPDTVVEERNLAVNISTLRKTLGETPDSHEYIVTIPGRGYRFVAPVRERNPRPAVERRDQVEQPAPSPRSFRQAIARSRNVLFAVGGFAALAAAFAVGRYFQAAPARPAMRFSAITNFAGVERQPAFSPDGRSVAFVSDRGGQNDIYVGLLSGGSLVRVTNDPNVEARPRWSPDGSKLLYARLNEWGLWDTWAIPALGGIPHRLVNNAADATWSPDGHRIAYANLATGSIWTCDQAGRDPRPLTRSELPAHHVQPAFSRDGRRLAFVRRLATGGPYGELAVADLATGDSRVLTGDGTFVGSPAWSPDDASVYFASGRGGGINIWKLSAHGGAPEQITVGQGDDADLDVSPDGRRILFSSFRTNINLEEITLDDSGMQARRWITTDAAHGELAPAYSRDGKHIAYFTNRKGAENEAIWVMDADGSNAAPLVQDERVNIHPRWSGDGQSIVFRTRTGSLGLGRSDEAELRRIPLSGGAPQSAPVRVRDYSGDVGPQDQFLFRGTDGQVRIFEPGTNRARTLAAVQGTFLRWCRDGRRFAALVPARAQNDERAGVWVYDLDGKPQQVFHGWAAFYAWSGSNEMFILEGKPDLNATLLRLRLDGSPAVRLGSIRLIYSYWHRILQTRFDVHPSGTRIVAEGLELHEADVSMIDNVR